jgi:hypothetical protein
MFKKALVLIVLIMTCLICISGCKKSSPDTGPADETVKNAAEYAAEAENQIDADNMADELDRIENELTQEETELP